MRSIGRAVLALGCWWLAAAQAQDVEREARPDLDFLEYLGAWAEEDDEWLAIEEWEMGAGAEADEAPERVEQERDDDDDGE